ncbi:MAG: hypothetical protein AAFQ64_12085 [Pseudomonadota bacterium]
MEKLYIAETAEDGEITAVWFYQKGARAPQVFDPERHGPPALDGATCFGATREKMQAWLLQTNAK